MGRWVIIRWKRQSDCERRKMRMIMRSPTIRSSRIDEAHFQCRVRSAECGTVLECGDLSPLLAGDLSPSTSHVAVMSRAAGRGSVWPTSRPNNQSGDKSPHSTFRSLERFSTFALLALTLFCAPVDTFAQAAKKKAAAKAAPKMAPAPAGAPVIASYEPKGLERGREVKVKLTGSNLGEVSEIVSAQPKLTGTIQPDGQTNTAWLKCRPRPGKRL